MVSPLVFLLTSEIPGSSNPRQWVPTKKKKKRTDACSLPEGPGGDSPGRGGLGLDRANLLWPNARNKTGPYPKPPWQRPSAEPRFPSLRDCCEGPPTPPSGIRRALQRSRTSGMAQEEWEQPTLWGLTSHAYPHPHPQPGGATPTSDKEWETWLLRQ